MPRTVTARFRTFTLCITSFMFLAALAAGAFASENKMFLTAVTYSTGEHNPYSVAVADLNRDGKPDLIVANRGLDDGQDGSVSVMLGNGDGTFQAAVNYDSGGTFAYSVAVADVNGDGNLDLVVAHGCPYVSCPADGVVGVLLGNGDGTFQAARSYDSGAGSHYQSYVLIAANLTLL